jgi:hypothetical protein
MAASICAHPRAAGALGYAALPSLKPTRVNHIFRGNARAVLAPGETFNHSGIVGPAIVVVDITQACRKRLAARLGRRSHAPRPFIRVAIPEGVRTRE